MRIVSWLEIQSIPWLLSLEYDAITFGADPKAKYEA